MTESVTLFLCGDVMTGRGIDQVLPHPSDPTLHEPYVHSAREYVALAEAAHGSIPHGAGFDRPWGDALGEIEARSPDWRIANLETSVTTSDAAEPKGINYRMHPANLPALTAAGLDCCVLANNHVLDWGVAGLLETLEVLHGAGIATAGAGRDAGEASSPAVLEGHAGRRVLVFGFAVASSGVPRSWGAGAHSPGVNLLEDLSARTAVRVAAEIRDRRSDGDAVVASVHWGGNWGYAVPREQREFALTLVDAGAVDVVHGHSSHHAKGIGCRRDRPILYGCGDFINDYEGIGGYEAFRADLALAYFVTLASSGSLSRLEMVPFRSVRFRLARATAPDGAWLRDMLDRESRILGGSVDLAEDGALGMHCTSRRSGYQSMQRDSHTQRGSPRGR